MTRTVQYTLFAACTAVAVFLYSIAISSTLFFDDLATACGAVRGFGGFFAARWVLALWNYLSLACMGLSVEAFRAQNVVLHLIIAGLMLALFNSIFEHMPQETWLFRRRRVVALMGSAFFLLHPLQTQTALHVINMRAEGIFVLSTLILGLLMFKAATYVGPLARNGWFWGALGFSCVVVGTKEASIVVPLLVMLLDWFFIARGSVAELRRRAVLYGIFFCVFYGMFFSVNSHLSLLDMVLGRLSVASKPGYLLTDSYAKPLSAYTYFLTQLPVIAHYAGAFVYPFRLCIDYDVLILTSWAHPAVLFGMSVVVLLVGGAVVGWYVKRSNLASFGVLWFLIALAPRVMLVPSSDIVGDYKTFLASVGVMMALAGVLVWGVEWLVRHSVIFESKVGRLFLVVCLCWGSGFLLSETKQYCELWSNPVEFWAYVKRSVPGRARNVYYAGLALAQAQRPNEALELYAQAVTLDDGYAQPLVRLGEWYHQNGEAGRALSHYLRAESVAQEPLAELHANKGLLFMEQGDVIRSEEEFKKALELCPAFSRGLYNYALLLKKLGRFTQAYATVNDALRCAPYTEDLQAQLLKARLAFEVREFKDVVATLEPRIEKTSDISLQFMLASAYYSSENYKKAAEWFEKVYSKRPDNLDVAYNYAQSLMKLERYSAAVPYFQQCASNDKYPFAQLHVATCFYRNGNHVAARMAVAALDQALISDSVRSELIRLKQDMHLTA